VNINVFETTIRVVGGLLSGFDLSGNRLLLDKAATLVDRLLMAFNTYVARAVHCVFTPSVHDVDCSDVSCAHARPLIPCQTA
jgi:hypothetical protein